MAKLQLTLSTDYVKTWGVWEAVREIVQNAMDGQQDGFEMKVSHSGDTLKVTNVGAKLDPSVWLLGKSSKSGGAYRGIHGEGLKLAALVLARKGHDMKIVNGDESWTPKIETSEVFGGQDVLTIYTHKRQSDSGSFSVEVGGIPKEAWALMRQRFLALSPPSKSVKTSYADVLFGDEFKGKVFVKGIFVQMSPDLHAGYDFHRVDTDRDRRMVAGWDLRYHAAKAWEEAMTQDQVEASVVVDMLSASAPETQEMASSLSYNPGAVAKLAAVFKERHGEDALPVSSMAEAREVEHFGQRGVVVQPQLVEALRKAQELNLDNRRQAFKQSVVTTYGWSDLSVEEKATYETAMRLVEAAAKDLCYAPVEDRLTIVDFGDDGLNGLYAAGKIQVAKHLLTSFESFLRVLVHEVAHDMGSDGEKSHEKAEGTLFCRIISNMMQS